MSLLKEVIEEKAEQLYEAPPASAQAPAIAFKHMDKAYDSIQNAIDQLGQAESFMKKSGLKGDFEIIFDATMKAYKDFEDTMPGLEMQARGER